MVIRCACFGPRFSSLSYYSAVGTFSYDAVLVENRTNHLPNEERMHYALRQRRGLLCFDSYLEFRSCEQADIRILSFFNKDRSASIAWLAVDAPRVTFSIIFDGQNNSYIKVTWCVSVCEFLCLYRKILLATELKWRFFTVFAVMDIFFFFNSPKIFKPCWDLFIRLL